MRGVLSAVVKLPGLLLSVLPVVGVVDAALAADCRTEVRALLVQSAPAADAVSAVRQLCTAASARGEADASYQLALLDLGPDGWRPERAIPLITQAADAGVPEAQYWLAWQQDTGPLLPNNPDESLRWYQAAAAQSHRLALARLADAYEFGELGLTPAPARATELRAQAAQCAAKSAL